MAAVTVSQIVKEALSEIKERHLMLTPENYTEVYNEISKKYGFTTEESKKIEKYISRLGDEYKNQAKTLHIKTVDEFVAFMTARLSRGGQQTASTQPADDKKLKSLNAFARRILQAISMLHNKEAKSLAEQGMQLLARRYDEKTLDDMCHKWFDFVSSYDTEFLDFLKYYGVRDFEDLKTMSAELEKFLAQKNDGGEENALVELLNFALEPSITKELSEELGNIRSVLKQNPQSLNSKEIQDKIKTFVDRRIDHRKSRLDK